MNQGCSKLQDDQDAEKKNQGRLEKLSALGQVLQFHLVGLKAEFSHWLSGWPPKKFKLYIYH